MPKIANAKDYRKWQEASENLIYWKEREMELRVKIADFLAENKPAGTHKFIKAGFEIKVVRKINTSVDKEALNSDWKNLDRDEQDCFRFKPELVAAKYKSLEDKKNVNKYLITKPGAPTLSITETED